MHSGPVPTLNHIAVKRSLEDKGISVSDLAEKIGHNRSNLSAILNGHRKGSTDLAVKIGAITGDNPYAYLGPDDPKAALVELCVRMGVTAKDLESAA